MRAIGNATVKAAKTSLLGWSTVVLAVSVVALPPTVLAEDAPNSDAADQSPTAPPPMLRKTVDDDLRGEEVEYRFKLFPAVVQPGKTVTVRVTIATQKQHHDANFGRRRSITGLRANAILVAPNGRKQWHAVRTVLALRDPGNYGFTFTVPEKKGIYGLYLVGRGDAVGSIKSSLPLSVGIWPIPVGEPLPKAPGKLPEPMGGDLAHGQALCKKYCQPDGPLALDGGQGSSGGLKALDSAAALTTGDDKLVAAVVGKAAESSLKPLERIDLVYYLNTLFFQIRHFFPKSSHYFAHDFTIGQHGKTRLKDTAGIALDVESERGTVLVVYGGRDRGERPILIDYDDRLSRDRLDRQNKLGYLVFTRNSNTALYEVALALSVEPQYKIVGARARDKDGTEDSKTAKRLRSLRGRGRFNNRSSLRGADRRVAKDMLPIYLRAAELATSYYSAEREFGAFDNEFTDLEADEE